MRTKRKHAAAHKVLEAVYDNASDITNATAAINKFATKDFKIRKIDTGSSLQGEEPILDEEKISGSDKTTGRTYPDIIHEHLTTPVAIILLLYFGAFWISAKSFGDHAMIYSVAAGTGLTAIYLIVRKIFRK